MTLGDKIQEEQAKSGAPRKEYLGRIAALLDRNGIDLDEVGRVSRVSLYQTITKNDEGEAEVHDLAAVQLSPAWEDGPQWPVIHPGARYRLPAPGKPPAKKDWSTCVILPDIQIGYFRNSDGNLEPTHDEEALNVALSVLKDAKPDVVVLVGDNLDLPEWGKYLTTQPFQQTTQASIDRASRLAFELRRAAGAHARIVWIAGNHEERMPRFIATNAAAAFGLRRGNTPESWPVLSVPYLCHFEETDIEFMAGYPASAYWINNRLRVIHGDKVNSNGVTATKFLAREKVSVIYGHIHRREWAEITREDHDGARTILAASPGCLARIDGAVPSVKGGTDLDGRPIRRHEDWQQGLAIVDFEQGDGDFHLELVPIREGKARWRGKDYAYQDDS